MGFNHPLSKILNLRLGLSIPSVSSAKWRIIHLPLTKGRSFFVRHSDREVDDVQKPVLDTKCLTPVTSSPPGRKAGDFA